MNGKGECNGTTEDLCHVEKGYCRSCRLDALVRAKWDITSTKLHRIFGSGDWDPTIDRGRKTG